MDKKDGVPWGEYTPVADESRCDFLNGTTRAIRRVGGLTQTTVKTVSGVEWMSRMLLKELADSAVDRAEWVKEASSWEEWREEEVTEQESKRSVQEERWLWKRLEESDSQQSKEERYITLKKSRKVAKAREKMKIGKEKPGIMDKLRRGPKAREVTNLMASMERELSWMPRVNDAFGRMMEKDTEYNI